MNRKINHKTGTTVHPNRRAIFWLDLLIPVLLLALGTVLIRALDLDLNWSGRFFDGKAWTGKQVAFFDFMYDYGTLPALLLSIAGLAIFLVSLFSQRISRLWKARGLFLLVVMLLGPGLIVNSLLKEHWGRPRPRSVSEFRSAADTLKHYSFEEVLNYDPASPGNSFPSGHASMGFYFFVLFFLFRKRGLWLSALLLLFPLVYGFGMGYVRVAQGGHFPSDVLWSGGIVYLTCAAAYYLLKLDQMERKGAQ